MLGKLNIVPVSGDSFLLCHNKAEEQASIHGTGDIGTGSARTAVLNVLLHNTAVMVTESQLEFRREQMKSD